MRRPATGRAWRRMRGDSLRSIRSCRLRTGSLRGPPSDWVERDWRCPHTGRWPCWTTPTRPKCITVWPGSCATPASRTRRAARSCGRWRKRRGSARRSSLLLELVEHDRPAKTSKPSNFPSRKTTMTRRRLDVPWTVVRAGDRRRCVAAPSNFASPGRPSQSVPLPDDRAGVASWKVDEAFKKDVFTFVRIEYDSGGFGRRGGGGFGGGFAGGGDAAAAGVEEAGSADVAAGSPTGPTATSISRSAFSN